MGLISKIGSYLRTMPPIAVAEAIRRLSNRIGSLNTREISIRQSNGSDLIASTSLFALASAIRKLKRRPELLLQSKDARKIITRSRFENFTKKFGLTSFDHEMSDSADNTLEYNRAAMEKSVQSARPDRLVYPLITIEQLHKRRRSAKVLSIGSRGEYELFALMSLDFRPENIFGLDLFSYSPLIEVGDAHHMPFEDDSFDVIVLGWVWAYSRNWNALAAELLRCSRDKAVLAISGDYSEPISGVGELNGTENPIHNCDEILSCFGEHVSNVYFRQDSSAPEIIENIVIFDVSKNPQILARNSRLVESQSVRA